MTCPTCGGELVPGADRCPVCEVPSLPRIEGALAADPRLVTPPARGKGRSDSPRDVVGAGRGDARDRSWREEVKARVRSRRQKRAEAGLPLFEEPVPPAPRKPDPESVRTKPVALPVRDEPRLTLPELSEVELADLPLQTTVPYGGKASGTGQGNVEDEARAIGRQHAATSPFGDEALLNDVGGEPELEPRLVPPPAESPSVERPARIGERVQAAAVDAALFVVVAAIVVYFTGRTAHVGVDAVLSAWPWLAAYQGLLAAFYAGYFTGTTGQTPGKLITGLRVIDTMGRPPGYLCAVGRAATGLLGITLGGLGLLPMVFDPALRAVHDRLFHTRVVRY